MAETLSLTVSLRGTREVKDNYQLFRMNGQLFQIFLKIHRVQLTFSIPMVQTQVTNRLTATHQSKALTK